jgi:hypothetical protein
MVPFPDTFRGAELTIRKCANAVIDEGGVIPYTTLPDIAFIYVKPAGGEDWVYRAPNGAEHRCDRYLLVVRDVGVSFGMNQIPHTYHIYAWMPGFPKDPLGKGFEYLYTTTPTLKEATLGNPN